MYTHTKQILIRSLLLLTAFLIALPLSLLINQAASAADPADRSAQDQAKLFTYYTAIRGCANKSLKDVIPTSSQDVSGTDPSSWFNNEVTSYVYPSGNTNMKCQDIMQGIASTWSSPDYGRFLESAGYKLDTSKPEYKWSAGQEDARRDNFTAAILQKSPGIDKLSDAAKYSLYLSSLFGDCKAEDKGLYSTLANTSFQTWANDSHREGDYVYKKITLADGDHVVKRLFNADIIVYGWKAHSAFTGIKDQNCQSISDTISQTAGAFAYEQAKIACKTTGPKYTSSSLIDACATGSTNKTAAITFCATKYPGVFSGGSGSTQQEEKSACFAGQGNGGGGDCMEAGFTTPALLQACINGSKNKGNTEYCNTTYPAPDNLKPGQPVDPKEAERNACQTGLSAQISVPGITQPNLAADTCAENPDAEGCKEEDRTSCAVEGVGWIVCPIAGFMGMMTDGLFGVLTTLLSFTPIRDNDATYSTWQAMRNIANAAFVIAFLIIIFSQLTGAGITNYGIKKMIPRLVAAAILVNVSFFICQIAVDLSNILGYSLQSLMTNASKTVSGTSNSLDIWGDLVGWIIAGGIGTLGIGSAALTITAAGGWVPALALLLPVLVTVLFAVITVVLVLAARQALIIILIVISPLAFVAYLLPNTEDWFHKWRKLFITLLLMFPIISVIFGGSQLAAAVIRAGTNNPLIYILSLAVQVIPFFLVPIIMKTAGGLLNRFGGMVNNPNKGPFDKLRKRAEDYAGYRTNNANAANMKLAAKMDPTQRPSRFSFVGRARRNAERSAIYSSADNRAKEAGVEYIGNQLSPDGTGNPANFQFASKMAGTNDLDALMQASARGASAVDEIEAKELKAGHVLLSNAQVDQGGLNNLLNGVDATGMNGTVVKATAATTKAAASLMAGQGRAMDVVVKTLATSGDEKMQKFAVNLMQQNYPKAKEKQIGLTSETLLKDIAGGKFAGNTAAFDSAYEEASADKLVTITVDNMATQEKSSLAAAKIGMSGLGATEVGKIRTTATALAGTPSARAKTSDDTFAIITSL
ncbi:hypothetical protein D3C85_405200 [compost metagenome]